MSKIPTLVIGFTLFASACATHVVEGPVATMAPASSTSIAPVPSCEADPSSCGSSQPTTTAAWHAPPTTETAEDVAELFDGAEPAEVPFPPGPERVGRGEVVSCSADGIWPEGAESPSILVSWTGKAWEYAGPDVRAAGAAQVAFDYYLDSPSGVFVGVVGLVEGMTWDDFSVVAEEEELGRYHMRGINGNAPRWNQPDWVVFVASLEHGCSMGGGTHRVLWNWNLPPAHYVVFGHSSPAYAEGSVVTADVIAEFDVEAINEMPMLTAAATNCAHLGARSLNSDGFPLFVYSQQPHGNPLCEDSMEEWIGRIQLIECQDEACADFTERTLAEVKYLWAGPYGLDVVSDGRIVTSWYVASSGHPVSEVTLVSAVCDAESCEFTEVRQSRPWNIDY